MGMFDYSNPKPPIECPKMLRKPDTHLLPFRLLLPGARALRRQGTVRTKEEACRATPLLPESVDARWGKGLLSGRRLTDNEDQNPRSGSRRGSNPGGPQDAQSGRGPAGSPGCQENSKISHP